jgi:hypothetical protein
MKLIGNTLHLIDWDTVINTIKDRSGNTLKYNDSCFPKTDDFDRLDKIWTKAGYLRNSEVVEWTNYFPGDDFDKTVVDQFRNIVRAEPWMVWISRIRPGKMAPWHFDAHSKIKDLDKLGMPIRFTCYIQSPQPGHVSIVENSSVYMPDKGSIYQWPSHDAWHCGMNGGLEDKFMFNYWGYK